MKRISGAVVLCLMASAAMCQQWPTTGLVYNTKDQASLDYDCNRSGETLECEFAQVGVRKKLTKADFEKKLAEGAVEKLEPIDAKQCASADQYVAWAEGRGPKPDGAVAFKFPEQKADAIRVLKAVRPYCAAPTRENANAILRASLDADTRTCVVRSWTFKQKFTLISDPGSGRKAWVVKSTPTGACGTVQLDRFEPEILSFGKSGTLDGWKYIARKAVTNPNGDALPGVKCSDLDEEVYEYTSDTRENTRPTKCDYIEFAVL